MNVRDHDVYKFYFISVVKVVISTFNYAKFRNNYQQCAK